MQNLFVLSYHIKEVTYFKIYVEENVRQIAIIYQGFHKERKKEIIEGVNNFLCVHLRKNKIVCNVNFFLKKKRKDIC
jgi:hypothetical protein